MGRHFFVVLLSCYAELSLAAVNEWNCEKNEAGEWSCVTETSGQPAKKQETVNPSATEPDAKKPAKKSKVKIPETTPMPIEPVITTVPNKPETVKADKIAAPKLEPKKAGKKLAKHEPVVDETKIQTAQSSAPVSLQPPSVQEGQQEGWSCAPGAENSTWDCHLVGVNPKGEAKIVEDENSLRLLDPAFSLQQERAFKSLQKEFPYDPWMQCSAPHQPKPKIVSKKHLRETSPLEIDSDFSEVFDKEITSFSGNVDMTRADQHLTADMASYDSASDVMDTQGNVYYNEEGLALYSNTASLRLATDKAILRNVLFESLNGPYRGSAEVAYKDSKELSHYKDAAYTSCSPGNQDWVLHTSRLKLNKDSGLGSATDAWLEFKGVPFVYTPYINFPIDNRRTTGFLPPSWGRTSRSGFQLSTPFYWNIAPNYDALIKPRYLSKRGPLFATDVRYLTEMTRGSAAIEFMPYDSMRKTQRFYGSLKNNTTFLPNLTAAADINYVSDRDYLYELGSALNFADRRYVSSSANLNYFLPGLSFQALLQRYQTIDSTIPAAGRPYQKIPQLNLNLNHSFDAVPVDLAMDNEFVYFYRTGRVSGQRFNTKPFITAPLTSAGAFATPKVSLQHTQYILENQTPGFSSAGRTTPIASLDTGVFLEQEFQAGDSSFLHTLEPRAFYLYVPRTNQDNIPVFDSALYDFNFSSLFRENRFSSIDRVQDANQVSLALTSRLLDAKTGLEYAKLGVGEIFYFNDRKVTLPGYLPETNRLSNLVTELSGSLDEHLSYSVGTQWSPHSQGITRAHASLQFANKANEIVNLGYLYRKEQVGVTVPIGQLDPVTGQAALAGDFVAIEQTDVSFRWPIYDDWYFMGRWLYALNFNATKESFIGLEKDSCCWRFSVIGRRYSNALSNTVESQLQTGVFVQLELKGLGSFGDKIDEFLEKNIAGYSKKQRND
jgi:LPS-assembly protein